MKKQILMTAFAAMLALAACGSGNGGNQAGPAETTVKAAETKKEETSAET